MKSFKFLLLTSLLLCGSSLAFAISSTKVSITSNNEVQENQAISDIIEELIPDLELIEISVSNMVRCADNNMIYLNKDAANVDENGCFSLGDIVASTSTNFPTLAGSTPGILLSAGSPDEPRFKVDERCHSTVNLNTRALTLDDLKYVYQSLHVPAYTGLTNIWLFDAKKSALPTDSLTDCTALTIDSSVPANPIFVRTMLPCAQANVSLVCVNN